MSAVLEHLQQKIRKQYTLLALQDAMKNTFTQVRIEQFVSPIRQDIRLKISGYCCGQSIHYKDSGFGYEDRVICPICGKGIVKLSSPHSSALARDLLIHWPELDSRTEFAAFWDTFGDNIWCTAPEPFRPDV